MGKKEDFEPRSCVRTGPDGHHPPLRGEGRASGPARAPAKIDGISCQIGSSFPLFPLGRHAELSQSARKPPRTLRNRSAKAA